MISRSYGATKRLQRGIDGCDRSQPITYSRRRASNKEKAGMAAVEAVRLPAVAKECEDCKTTTTPLWRCGPSGPKSLCNACGIKFGKSRNKSEPADNGEKSSSEMWEELKRRQKEKQQKLLLILLQQQREDAAEKHKHVVPTNSISRSSAFRGALGEAERKKKRRKRGRSSGGSGRSDQEAEAALLLLSLSSAPASQFLSFHS